MIPALLAGPRVTYWEYRSSIEKGLHEGEIQIMNNAHAPKRKEDQVKAVISSLLFALGILPISVLAGDQSGSVLDIRVASLTNWNASHVMINGTWNSRPACATIGWWAFDIDTPSGRAMLATLLTAKVTGKTVILWGAGTCTLNGVMETLLQVSIQP